MEASELGRDAPQPAKQTERELRRRHQLEGTHFALNARASGYRPIQEVRAGARQRDRLSIPAESRILVASSGLRVLEARPLAGSRLWVWADRDEHLKPFLGHCVDLARDADGALPQLVIDGLWRLGPGGLTRVPERLTLAGAVAATPRILRESSAEVLTGLAKLSGAPRGAALVFGELGGAVVAVALEPLVTPLRAGVLLIEVASMLLPAGDPALSASDEFAKDLADRAIAHGLDDHLGFLPDIAAFGARIALVATALAAPRKPPLTAIAEPGAHLGDITGPRLDKGIPSGLAALDERRGENLVHVVSTPKAPLQDRGLGVAVYGMTDATSRSRTQPLDRVTVSPPSQELRGYDSVYRLGSRDFLGTPATGTPFSKLLTSDATGRLESFSSPKFDEEQVQRRSPALSSFSKATQLNDRLRKATRLGGSLLQK